ncbi:phosphomevalonate kinase [Dellaglioa sp. P0083]|uniref:phosphomevalonate kinase n=1 Tax=Dellaglioa kimchii TaxID=3344667 RepID=UPI0038D356D0
MITAKAPGKLYIAGEYAIVEPGSPAIIVAIDQFVTVTIKKSKETGSISSKQYQENSLSWYRQGTKIIFDNRDNPFHYILSAIHLTELYAQSIGKQMVNYHVNIDSDLDSTDGKKYGLGSSAAVTVATVRAVSQFYNLKLTDNALFKLSAMAHLDVQGNGSLGDIAASVYGGWIAYYSFDRDWLKIMRKGTPLTELLTMDWPMLSVQRLPQPKDLELLIGWTGSPASTSIFVDKMALFKAKQKKTYSEFLEDSKKCVTAMINGFKLNNSIIIQQEITNNRMILQQLADASQVIIETESLTSLCNLSESQHAAAKTSGAGGGDCGIALATSETNRTELFKDWAQNDIQPLNIKVTL